MSEVSKVPNTVLLIKDQRACWRCQRCETLYSNTNKGSKGYVCRRCRKWCLWLLHNTAYRVLLLMSEVSKVNVLCIQGPSPLQGGRLFIWAFCPVGLAVHHQSVRGGSFVNFLGLVKLQGWLQARHTANPQFLKLKGAQQPGNSYISMGTKLHPPYPNQDCLPVFWSEKCLQCLKNMGLYNSFGIGRFSLWHSWLTQASRLANSQASASNDGVPGDPNSPESNCLYLALIWSVKELYSLCASCTVNK